MKSYEETAKKILCRRDAILKKRAEKRKKVMTLCTGAASFCLALVIGIGISRGTGNEKEPLTIGGEQINEIQEHEIEVAVEAGVGNKHMPEIYHEDSGKKLSDESESPFPATTSELVTAVTSSKTGLVTPPPEDAGGMMDICRGLVYINRIVGEASAAKRAYDKPDYYSEQISADTAQEYYGMDIEKILKALPVEMSYIPSEHTFIKKNDGTIADDSVHFYITGKGNESITISCGRALPPYDCIYMLKNEMSNEVITESGDTVELLLGYKDNDEENGICGLFFADFKLGDTYYRIEFRNINTLDGTIGTVINSICR